MVGIRDHFFVVGFIYFFFIIECSGIALQVFSHPCPKPVVFSYLLFSIHWYHSHPTMCVHCAGRVSQIPLLCFPLSHPQGTHSWTGQPVNPAWHIWPFVCHFLPGDVCVHHFTSVWHMALLHSMNVSTYNNDNCYSPSSPAMRHTVLSADACNCSQ